MQPTLFEIPEQPKKTIILSLRPKPYTDILNGTKKYEYRRKFSKEAVSAFIYVSSPAKAIQGYIEFGMPIIDKIENIAAIAEEEKPGSREGTLAYLDGLEKGFAIPILSIREIQPLSLEELRSDFHFTAPQSYINVDTNPGLKEDLMKRLQAFYQAHR